MEIYCFYELLHEVLCLVAFISQLILDTGNNLRRLTNNPLPVLYCCVVLKAKPNLQITRVEILKDDSVGSYFHSISILKLAYRNDECRLMWYSQLFTCINYASGLTKLIGFNIGTWVATSNGARLEKDTQDENNSLY